VEFEKAGHPPNVHSTRKKRADACATRPSVIDSRARGNELPMATPEIIRKLTEELDKGVTTEVQVVYVLAGVRKLIERDKAEDQYPNLRFHCDWVLHSGMDRAAAKAILRQFDDAHPLLKDGIELRKLPSKLMNEINRISKMKSFEEELSGFLTAYGLPSLSKHRPDGWIHFLHLYTMVIEDIPLMVSLPKTKAQQGPPGSAPKHISHVVVHFKKAPETIKHPQGEDVLYTVTWRIHDKNGGSGDLDVYNTFSI
jgi:hypothetical protein